MEFYININPANPQELKEYLEILSDKNLTVKVDKEPEKVPIEKIPYEKMREKAVNLSKMGHAATIKKILLNRFEVSKISDLEEDDYSNFMHMMEEIENANQD